MIIDKSKTEKVLQGIGENVKIEDVNKYLQKQGVLVKIHCNRIRGTVELSPKIFGIDKDSSEEMKNFFGNYIKNGKLSFIPKECEKQLIAIESKLRMELRRETLGFDNQFLTLEDFKIFQKNFEASKKMLFEKRDEIIMNWEQLISDFKIKLLENLDAMNALDKEEIYNKIIERIPTRTRYRDSFNIYLDLKAFPVYDNLNIQDDEIQKCIKESGYTSSLNTVYSIIGKEIIKIFEMLNDALIKFDENGKFSSQKNNQIQRMADKLLEHNLFNNIHIIKISQELKSIKPMDDDSKAEVIENIMGFIYNFANNYDMIDLFDFSDCIYTEEELNILSQGDHISLAI